MQVKYEEQLDSLISDFFLAFPTIAHSSDFYIFSYSCICLISNEEVLEIRIFVTCFIFCSQVTTYWLEDNFLFKVVYAVAVS